MEEKKYKSLSPCRFCKSSEHHFYELKENNEGHSDERHICENCNKSWYIEGSDY